MVLAGVTVAGPAAASERPGAAEPPVVTVIMPFLNAERFIAEAIQSVVGQTLRNWELILVDDGSTDSSAAIATTFIERHPARMRLLRHPGGVNRGIAASRNLGMTAARGRYIALLDADDIYEPARLERHVACLERDPDVGVVLSHDLYWHGWESTGGRDRDIADVVIGPAVEPNRRYEPPALIASTLMTRGAPMPPPCGLTFRTDIVRARGGIPEEFRAHYEDQVLVCKLLLSYPAVVLADVLARYRQHPGSVTSGNSPLETTPGSPAMRARERFLDWLKQYLADLDLAVPELCDWIESERAVLATPAGTSVRAPAALGRVRETVIARARRVLPRRVSAFLGRLRNRLEEDRVRRRVMTLIARLERPRRPAENAATSPAIRAYWDARIDDTKLSDHPRGSAGFYEALDAYHLEKCDYLLRRVDFAAWQGRDVLEIGCGSGLDLVRFARAGARVTGVDVSPAALELAAGYCGVAGVEASLLEADGARLPVATGSFDLVYCTGVLPFAADPAAIVAEAHRVLRPGGQAIFMVYNRRSWMSALSALTGRREGHADAPGFHLYSRPELDRLLAAFPRREIVAERFPAPSPRRHGLAGFAVNRALIPALRALPDIFWRPYGWHLLAFCRKAA